MPIPGLHGFQTLCKAARKVRVGKGVEAWTRHYLETGRRPGVGRKRKSDPKIAWPLPPPEVEVSTHSKATEAPMTGILIQLAIAEKKPDEVLKWYDYAGRKKGGSRLSDFLVDATKVAEAIKSAYPDRAIAIWQETAEGHIAQVNTSGYEASVPYLRKMKNGAHAGWSQAGMGRVSSFLAGGEQAAARGVWKVLDRLERRPPANHRRVVPLTTRRREG